MDGLVSKQSALQVKRGQLSEGIQRSRWRLERPDLFNIPCGRSVKSSMMHGFVEQLGNQIDYLEVAAKGFELNALQSQTQQREYDDSYDSDDWDDADDSISGALSILVALVMLIWQYFE